MMTLTARFQVRSAPAMRARCLMVPGLLAAALGLFGPAALAEEFKGVFSMEAPTLRPLPADALAAVRKHARKTDDRDCAAGGFVGEQVDLEGRHRASDWIAITSDGCAWGASTAVIWILRRESTSYRVVLYTGGHSVGLGEKRSQGLVDVKTYHTTAGYHSETHYRYDGRQYVPVKSRDIDLRSPADCKRNRDLPICRPHR